MQPQTPKIPSEKVNVPAFTLRDRLEILEMAQNQRTFTEIVDGKETVRNFRDVYNEAISTYSPDALILFANTAVWIMEPRESGDYTELPMVLRPKQEEFLRLLFDAIDRGYNVHCDKTRDTGASWCLEIALAWFSLFTRNFMSIQGSIIEDKVDKKGEKGTLFAKLDFIIESLKVDTPWLYPEGYTDKQPNRTHMKLAIPSTGAVITGQAPNERFGRGDRQKCIICDEFAYWTMQREAFAAMSQTSNCLIFVSTPNGPGNLFAQLAHPKSGVKTSVRRFTLSWEDDPSKNYWEANDDPEAPWYYDHPHGALIQPWLEAQKIKYSHDPVLMAQEIFIDYNRSMQGIIYGGIDKARIGHFKWNPDFDLFTAWDFGVTDHTAILWIQWDHINYRHRIIDCLMMNGKSIFWYIPFITGRDIHLGENDGGYTPAQLKKIESHASFVYNDHYGDPDVKKVNQISNTSIETELRKFRITIRYNHEKNNHPDRIAEGRKRLHMLDIDADNCEDFIDAMRSYKFKDVNPDAQVTTPNNKPVHNWASHPASAYEFYCITEKNKVRDDRMRSKSYQRIINNKLEVPSEELIEVFGSVDRYLRLKNKGKNNGSRRISRGGTGY